MERVGGEGGSEGVVTSRSDYNIDIFLSVIKHIMIGQLLSPDRIVIMIAKFYEIRLGL